MLTETVYQDDEEQLEFAWDGERFAGVIKTLSADGSPFMLQVSREGVKGWRNFAARDAALAFLS